LLQNEKSPYLMKKKATQTSIEGSGGITKQRRKLKSQIQNLFMGSSEQMPNIGANLEPVGEAWVYGPGKQNFHDLGAGKGES